MDALVLEGVYENGRIELRERPLGVRRARVRVTFLPESEATEEEARAGREPSAR